MQLYKISRLSSGDLDFLELNADVNEPRPNGWANIGGTINPDLALRREELLLKIGSLLPSSRRFSAMLVQVFEGGGWSAWYLTES